MGDHGEASRGARILRNTAVLTGAGLVTKLGLLVFTIYAANVLGSGQFGDYAFLMAAISVAIVLADLGVENYSERELARTPSLLSSWLPLLVTFRVGGVALTGLGLGLVIGLTEVGRRAPWLILLGPVLLLAMGVFQLLRAALRSTERMGYEAGLSSGERFSFMALATLSLLFGWGLTGFVSAQVVATVLGTGAAVVLILMRVGRRGWTWPPEAGKLGMDTFRHAFPFGLSAVCVIILFREDALMLRFLAGPEETGRYGVAFRVMEGSFLFPQMVSLAVYPTFSIAFHRKDRLESMYHPLLRGLAVLGTGGAAIGILAARPLFSIFKPEYWEATGILTILLIAVPFVYGNYLVGTTLRAADRQVQNLIASALAMVVNFMANLALIPILGGRGAAAATLITQIFYFVTMSVQAWRLVDGRQIVPTLVKVAAAGAAAWWIGSRFDWWLLGIVSSLTVFIVCAFVLGAARFEDIRFVLNALRSREGAMSGAERFGGQG